MSLKPLNPANAPDACEREALKIVEGQCARMNETIKQMVRITSYETKPYPGGKNNLDLERASGEEPKG